MARPERKTVDYFPHYISDGKKMFFVEQKYGNDGYACWFKILESLASTEDHFLDLSNQADLMFLSAKCRVEQSVLTSILDDLSLFGEIDKDLWIDRIVWSEKFIESIQDAYKKRNNKSMTKEGLRLLLIGLGRLKPLKYALKGDGKPQRKEKDNKADQTKEEKIEERKLKFADTLKPFVEIYGRELINEFYKYWTEPNRSGTKFKQELQTTWSIDRRLETWANNDKTFKPNNNGTTSNSSKQPFKRQTMDERLDEAKRQSAERRSQRDVSEEHSSVEDVRYEDV